MGVIMGDRVFLKQMAGFKLQIVVWISKFYKTSCCQLLPIKSLQFFFVVEQ